MIRKKIVFIGIVLCLLVSLVACGKKCANGCGNAADSKCMAEMCDACCDYYMGLNGCYAKHYDSKWD